MRLKDDFKSSVIKGYEYPHRRSKTAPLPEKIRNAIEEYTLQIVANPFLKESMEPYDAVADILRIDLKDAEHTFSELLDRREIVLTEGGEYMINPEIYDETISFPEA